MAANYNKKIFALLLDRARGDRNLKAFAEDCDISYIQLRKLSLCEQENPPGMRLIKKLGAHSVNDVTTEDFAFAAGYFAVEEGSIEHKVSSLPPKQRRSAEEYVDYLLYVSEKNKKRKGDN
ncbi:MAG: hypothetical protein IJC49_04055 [Clostridia bacterium]|nr:hypothetical protein [Clostridia bacterium]